jgi:hypothetical protein
MNFYVSLRRFSDVGPGGHRCHNAHEAPEATMDADTSFPPPL